MSLLNTLLTIHILMRILISMNITTYIRKEDEHKWKSIENKSQWMHEMLNKGYKVITNNPDGSGKVETAYPPEPTYEKVPALVADRAPKIKVLDNDALKALLGGKATPIKDEPRHICKDNCKHWIWDTNSGKYNNSLTGEVRDAPEF